MEFDETSKLEWLEYDLFEKVPQVTAVTFLRHGGSSEKDFFSLNLSDAVGDNYDCVKVNRELVRKALGLSDLIFLNQKHGVDIVEVTPLNLKKTLQADAFYTREKDIGLVITHADCQAALIYDPESNYIAALHAGWKGLIKNMYTIFIDEFCRSVFTKPENLIIAVSPSLCSGHAEFKTYKRDIPKEFWSYQTEKFYFDLREIARKQILNTGVKEENLEITDTCTYCNERDYFSYRRNKRTGRHGSLIAIKEK